MKKQNEQSMMHCLRRPNKMDKWTRFGLGSPGTYPLDGLPQWSKIPLDQKLPGLALPTGTVHFSRGATGTDLLAKEKVDNFRLHDSNGYVTYIPYEALHDSHLAEHLHRPVVDGHLTKQGLVKDDAALCDLQTINKYRQYKRFMNLEQVYSGMKKEEEVEREKRRLFNVEEQIAKQKAKWNMLQKVEEASRGRREEEAEQEFFKKCRWSMNKVTKAKRVEELQMARARKTNELKMQSLMKKQKVDRKLNEIEKLGHIKVLKLIRKMREREKKVEYQTLMKRHEDFERKQKEKKDKWEAKKRWMAEQECISQRIISAAEEEHQINIERRKTKATLVKQEQKIISQRIKLRRIIKREEYQKRRRGDKVRKSIVDVWLKKCPPKSSENVEYILKKPLESMSNETRHLSEGSDNYNAMMVLKGNIEKIKDVATPALYVIDCILEKVIEESVKNTLRPLIEKLEQKMLEYGSGISSLPDLKSLKIRREDSIIRRPKSLPMPKKGEEIERRNSMEGHLGIENSKSKKLNYLGSDDQRPITRKSIAGDNTELGLQESTAVRFQTVMAEGKSVPKKCSVSFGPIREFHVLDFPADLKQVSSRRKTPMPSLEDLALTAWEDPFIEMYEGQGEMAFPEKQNLELLCNAAVARVAAMVSKIVGAAMEPTTRWIAVTRLAKMQDADLEEVITVLCKGILGLNRPELRLIKNKNRKILSCEEEAASLLARKVIARILKPPLFRPKENDNAVRYKIMFLNHF